MGALESAVLEQLWARADGATPSQVHAALGSDLAYTTVMTILTRLWKKGLADRERRGRAFVYRPTLSEAEFVSRRMGRALDQTQDRPAALTAFVRELSTDDSEVLRRLLHRR
jgi:predicted transcriptional regulator